MKAMLVAFLRNIPQSNQDAHPFSHFATDSDSLAFLRGYATLLQTLGLVDLHGDTVRARSQTAKYALNSLAETVEHDLRIVDDWKTRGLQANPFANGASFLKALEEHRLQALPDAQPSRVERVAQVLIKRTHPTTGQPELLFQFDRNAQQFQLIGGRYSPRDHDDLRQTIIREIAEELPNNALTYGVDYQLTCLIEDLVTPPTISATFGALTRYHFAIYHMTDLNQEIVLQTGDQWLTIEAILHNQAHDAEGQHKPFTNSPLFHTIDAQVGGLAQLENSFRHIE